jgi:hypothetical protein
MKKETNIDQSFVKHLREVLGAKIKEARKSGFKSFHNRQDRSGKVFFRD